MFTNELIVQAGKPGKWILIRALYWVDRKDKKWIVPAGFETNLANLGIFDRNRRSRKAAVLHDWLYTSKLVSRAEADRMFLEALADCGVSAPIRWAMYLGVRIGGWWHYND